MIKTNTILAAVVVCLLAPLPAQSAPQTLDELIRQVRELSTTERRELRERVERFEQERNRQRELLEQARAELADLEARSEQLQRNFESNASQIQQNERRLRERMGYLNELHGVVRQIAGDMQSSLETSLVSAQKPGRAEQLERLATSTELPSIEEIEVLWQKALDEIAESGKVVQFNAPVVDREGREAAQSVIRVGTFNALANGHYLRFVSSTGKLVEPQRQPSGRHLALVRDLETASEGIRPFAIDPTRGTLLSLLIQTPDLQSRIQQGGPIGYVIIVLAIIGLLLAIERFIVLSRVNRKVRGQLKEKQPGENPLGRIMQVYFDNKHVDTDTLGHKLDESILREVNPLQRGLGTLAILAAVAPLLGLLGTVTGIIATFQSITLFGTGDPRMMSAGISEALVTTVLGLLTAIPLLLIHSFLSSKSNAVIQILDQQSAAYIAALAEDEHKRNA